jgi:hypothetical protein
LQDNEWPLAGKANSFHETPSRKNGKANHSGCITVRAVLRIVTMVTHGALLDFSLHSK